jgi:sarcosine oxidase
MSSTNSAAKGMIFRVSPRLQSTAMKFDVLVLGVGGMGAAALAHLAARGVRTIGIEQDEVPSRIGSSVGQTRIIRKAYFEDARYVPLLGRSYALWRELEAETRQTLFVRTGCLNLGPADHPDIAGVLESVRVHHLPHERLGAAGVRERFPAFVPAEGDIGVFEEDAGYLRVEACTEAHADVALKHGAELRARTSVRRVSISPTEVRATLGTGEEIAADTLVVAAGPWLPKLELADGLPPLVVTRQLQCWFEPRDLDLARAPRMPAFIHFTATGAYYGLPITDDGARGIKVCRHYGGEPTSPEMLDRSLRPADEADVRSYIVDHLPNASGPLVHAQACMYTTTPDAHFVVGLHPRHSNVVVLGGFSGHGYKLATVMGEIAAELATRGRTDHDISLFDPSRRAAPR